MEDARHLRELAALRVRQRANESAVGLDDARDNPLVHYPGNSGDPPVVDLVGIRHSRQLGTVAADVHASHLLGVVAQHHRELLARDGVVRTEGVRIAVALDDSCRTGPLDSVAVVLGVIDIGEVARICVRPSSKPVKHDGHLTPGYDVVGPERPRVVVALHQAFLNHVTEVLGVCKPLCAVYIGEPVGGVIRDGRSFGGLGRGERRCNWQQGDCQQKAEQYLKKGPYAPFSTMGVVFHDPLFVATGARCPGGLNEDLRKPPSIQIVK